MRKRIAPQPTYKCFVCQKDGFSEPHEHGPAQLSRAIRKRMMQDWKADHGR